LTESATRAMLDRMTTFAIAAAALIAMSAVIGLIDARRRLAEIRAELDRPAETLQFERTELFTDERIGDTDAERLIDPTWWPRAASYGHAPELSYDEHRELAPLFERFDRVMTAMFARLDEVAA
jgi:hypothetical protein